MEKEKDEKDSACYSMRKIQIHQDHELYEWCAKVTSLSNNLYNAGLFHIRQCMTGLQKDPDKRQPLEKEVIEKIEAASRKDDAEDPKRNSFLPEDITNGSSTMKTKRKIWFLKQPCGL